MRYGSLLSAVVLTTLAIFLTGCSRNPVAPTIDPSASHGAGTAAVSVDPTDAPPSDGGTPLTRIQTLATTDEGLLVVGRWTLWIRKNSLTMPATVTLHVSDPEAMSVQIDVQPAAANNFKQPVILTANTSDVAGFDYSSGGMLIWSNGDWANAGASSHPNQQDVVGHLSKLANAMVTDGVSGKKISL
jgi:hypothetical protein